MLVARHYSIQKWPSTVKKVGTNVGFSEVTSHLHLDKPTWLISWAIYKNFEVFQALFLISKSSMGKLIRGILVRVKYGCHCSGIFLMIIQANV